MLIPTKREPDTIFYVTSVTYNRVPVFQKREACELFFAQVAELKKLFPFKLIGYVLMPDHFHLLVNLADGDIEKFLLRLRGNSARKIIDWLKNTNRLNELRLRFQQKRNHKFSLWQKNPFVVELYSEKFLRQKLNYLHLNPVRAGLCEHPADYEWSSYQAYAPVSKFPAPIEIDWSPFWTDEERNAAIEKAAMSKRPKGED